MSNILNRANDFRRANDFDRAILEYENALRIAERKTVSGYYHTVGLKSDGTVVTCGRNKYGQCGVSDWKNIKVK